MEKIENLNGLAVAYAPKIIVGLSLIGATVLAAYLVRSILKRVFRKFIWAASVGTLISTTVFYSILILGILTGLSTMGVNMTPIIAGLGLGGFALGFALRDALSNLLAGVLVIIYQPFREGDTLSVMGCQGTVTEVNLRYTVLENQLERFMVPNSLIFTKPLKIINPTERNESE